ADFIGTTNLLDGVVEQRDAGVTFVRLTGGDVVGTSMNGLAPGVPVELCVRPGAIRPVVPGETGSIAARVEQAASLGTTIQYQVRTSGGQALTVPAPKTGSRLPVGTDVAVSWSPSEARVLGGGASGSQEEDL